MVKFAFGPTSLKKPDPKPAEGAPAAGGADEDDDLFETVADELVNAVHAKDKKGVSSALRAFRAVAKAKEAKDGSQR